MTCEENIELKQNSVGAELRESYLDFQLGEHLFFSLGNKLIVFGQFDLFSPIDLFALPTRFGSNEIGFSKVNNRLTQQTLETQYLP